MTAMLSYSDFSDLERFLPTWLGHCFGRYGNHRARSFSDNILCHAPQKKSANSFSSVDAHYNQVDAFIPSELDDSRPRSRECLHLLHNTHLFPLSTWG